MILVVGSTGTLGRKVARSLLAAGRDVRVMTRQLARVDELKKLGAKPVRADLNDPHSLEFALRGVRAVVTAAHSMLGRRDEASDLVDDAGHRSLIDAAREAGVEHFVYTSVVGASPDHPIDFWRSKARVERYLEESGLAYTIIRPTAFMEMHAYQLIGKAVLEGKRVILFGRGQNPRNYVAAEDVAKTIHGVLQLPALRGEILEIGGPENLTAHQVVETFERVSGRRAKVMHVPLAAVRVMSRVLRPLHPGVSRVMRAAIVAETTDQTFDPARFRSRVPITLTALDRWVHSRMAG
ncbi:MAG: SDR family oxidoreductase [Gemmatimonadales bacterium]